MYLHIRSKGHTFIHDYNKSSKWYGACKSKSNKKPHPIPWWIQQNPRETRVVDRLTLLNVSYMFYMT